MSIVGVVHNARRVTFDGRDCWIASIEKDGRLLYKPSAADNVQECDSKEEAIAWARARVALLGGDSAVEVVLENGGREKVST